jgi:ribosomal protein L40E
MQPFVLSPFVILVLVVVFVVVATGSSSRRRREAARRYEMKVCGHCGTTQPAHAAFCRECGRRM